MLFDSCKADGGGGGRAGGGGARRRQGNSVVLLRGIEVVRGGRGPTVGGWLVSGIGGVEIEWRRAMGGGRQQSSSEERRLQCFSESTHQRISSKCLINEAIIGFSTSTPTSSPSMWSASSR
jgi:hypothetical protein